MRSHYCDMSYLQELRRAINGQMPIWAGARIIPRGMVIPIDPRMGGAARFGTLKSERGAMGVLVPNNVTVLGDDIDAGQRHIHLRRSNLHYLTGGALLQIGNLELVELASPDADDPTKWYTVDELTYNHDIRTEVAVWGMPASLISAGTLDDQVLEVRSGFPMIAGDHVAIPGPNESLREYEVVAVLDEENRPVELFPATITTGTLGVSALAALAGTTFNMTVDGNPSVATVFGTPTSAADVEAAINSAFTGAGQAAPASVEGFKVVLTSTDQGEVAEVSILPGTANAPLGLNPLQVRGQADVYEFPIIYQIQIRALHGDPGLNRTLSPGATIFLRAYPAYISEVLPLPRTYWHAPSASLGPVVLDACLGKLAGDPTDPTPKIDTEIIEIEYWDGCGASLGQTRLFVSRGEESEYLAGIDAQQAALLSAPFLAEHMALWENTFGQIVYEKPLLRIVLDAQGRATLRTPIVPALGVCSTCPALRVQSHSALPYTLTLWGYPRAPITHPALYIPSTSATPVFRTRTAYEGEGLIEALNIEVVGQAGQEVFLHSIQPVQARIDSIQYKVLMRGTGYYDWASSGLLLKPLSLSAELMNSSAKDAAFNRGHLFLDIPKCQPR